MVHFLEMRAVQLCALAVLHPWLKPAVRPIARWLMNRYPA